MPTIDIHAHWYPEEWLKLFEKDGPKEGARLERSPKGYTIHTERITNAFDDEFVNLDLRLQGMRGLYVATNINGADLDEKRFWDIYARAEDLGWTVYLHPVDTIGRERTTRYYLKNLLGNPYDTGVAAASLIFGGVLDAFPKLKVNLPHAGGTFPWLIGRLDHGTRVRPELKHMKRMPSEYLRRFSYDTIGHDDRINANLVRLVGAERVLLGSDYCFDMGLTDPVATVERLQALTGAERDMIRGGTAARLLCL